MNIFVGKAGFAGNLLVRIATLSEFANVVQQLQWLMFAPGDVLNQAHDARRVLIEDDGVGMSLTPDEMDNHFGLSIMQERADSIGATLQIESEPGDGTRIILTLPIMQDKALGDSV